MSDEKQDSETKKKVRVPWVLKDDNDLLVERMSWELAVGE